jgi:hypothetical protein
MENDQEGFLDAIRKSEINNKENVPFGDMQDGEKGYIDEMLYIPSIPDPRVDLNEKEDKENEKIDPFDMSRYWKVELLYFRPYEQQENQKKFSDLIRNITKDLKEKEND